MLSVIIVNYKNPELLRLSLKSLARTINKELDHEIVVVDISASVETRNVALESPDIPLGDKVIYVPFKENIGYTKGVNEGIKASRGDQYFIINSDIVPMPESLRKLSDFLRSNDKVGLVGPKLLNFDGSRQESCFRFYRPMTIIYRRTLFGKLPWAKKEINKFLMRDVDTSKTISVDWLMGSALMVSKTAIQKVGLMDERFFLYFSEVDWARRFWENNYRVAYYPESVMYHYHRRESKGAFSIFDIFVSKVTRWHAKDAVKYFLKYGLSNRSYLNDIH